MREITHVKFFLKFFSIAMSQLNLRKGPDSQVSRTRTRANTFRNVFRASLQQYSSQLKPNPSKNSAKEEDKWRKPISANFFFFFNPLFYLLCMWGRKMAKNHYGNVFLYPNTCVLLLPFPYAI